MHHLRYAGLTDEEQRNAFLTIIQSQTWLVTLAEQLRDADLPDSWIVAGVLYNSVWNVLTGRDPIAGIKDIDVFYHDATDLSYEAEDRLIQKSIQTFANPPVQIEIRNQARVHLWFETRFGFPVPPHKCSKDSIRCFSSRAYALGLRIGPDGKLDVFAPFGFEDLFSFRLTPNLILPNKQTHDAKAEKALRLWPELTFVPWPETASPH